MSFILVLTGFRILWRAYCTSFYVSHVFQAYPDYFAAVESAVFLLKFLVQASRFDTTEGRKQCSPSQGYYWNPLNVFPAFCFYDFAVVWSDEISERFLCLVLHLRISPDYSSLKETISVPDLSARRISRQTRNCIVSITWVTLDLSSFPGDCAWNRSLG